MEIYTLTHAHFHVIFVSRNMTAIKYERTDKIYHLNVKRRSGAGE